MSIGSFAPGTGALAQNSPPRQVYLAFDLAPFRASGGRALWKRSTAPSRLL
jgi:hypothetical protein